ncbi:MAG: hypothetical protein AB1714_09730 [Acidobacteriota bacterium]
MEHENHLAQWAFDTKSILGRFHLWLENVEERMVRGDRTREFSFVGPALEKGFIVTAAVTALGTRLFGRYGEGKGLDKSSLNLVKKDADAISAYAMSEALWYLTRGLPENHAVMVSLGEGLMPKVGETPEMGSNPLLGFGRVYARPQVARYVDRLVHRLINDPFYRWEDFWADRQRNGITIWGAAIDTLENTSRFVKGSPTGPMGVLHLFDQPLRIALPYEGYMGYLALPRKVVETAADRSVLLNYLAPRALVMECIRATYPGIRPEHVHVWTLGGRAREPRIGELWEEWRSAGAHLVEDGWVVPGGGPAFGESGTYAPTYAVGPFQDPEGNTHLLLCDGYAATAEAIQAASLDPMLDLTTSMAVFSSKFDASYRREAQLMHLDPDSATFPRDLADLLGRQATDKDVDLYRGILRHAAAAGMPLARRTVTVDDFFPKKEWSGLALAGYMLPDPYAGVDGVEEVGPLTYRVTTRATSERGIREIALTLRLLETFEESKRVFSPLLDRFYAGQDYKTRPVKISDSGRIRNELQTWYSEALEFIGDEGIRIFFDRVDDTVVPPEKKDFMRHVLSWYKQNHPIWFRWLEVA